MEALVAAAAAAAAAVAVFISRLPCCAARCRPWSACRDSYGSAGERFDQHLYRSADAAYLHRFIEQSSRDMYAEFMSDDTWKLSFGKFLEVYFYNRLARCAAEKEGLSSKG